MEGTADGDELEESSVESDDDDDVESELSDELELPLWEVLLWEVLLLSLMLPSLILFKSGRSSPECSSPLCCKTGVVVTRVGVIFLTKDGVELSVLPLNP